MRCDSVTQMLLDIGLPSFVSLYILSRGSLVLIVSLELSEVCFSIVS